VHLSLAPYPAIPRPCPDPALAPSATFGDGNNFNCRSADVEPKLQLVLYSASCRLASGQPRWMLVCWDCVCLKPRVCRCAQVMRGEWAGYEGEVTAVAEEEELIIKLVGVTNRSIQILQRADCGRVVRAHA